MASIGSLAQSVATSTTNQAKQIQASGPFNSLRSGAAFISYILKDVLGLDPVLIVNASLLFAAVSTFSRWISNTLYRQAKEWIVSTVTIQDDDPLYSIVLNILQLILYVLERTTTGWMLGQGGGYPSSVSRNLTWFRV